MHKIAINTCFGGFNISDQAFIKLLDRKGVDFDIKIIDDVGPVLEFYEQDHFGDLDHELNPYDFTRPEDRDDPDLIAVIEELGEKANGYAADIKIVEIPDDVDWYIHDYDGIEHVAEKHRIWR